MAVVENVSVRPAVTTERLPPAGGLSAVTMAVAE
jgi:hypothetical protein